MLKGGAKSRSEDSDKSEHEVKQRFGQVRAG